MGKIWGMCNVTCDMLGTYRKQYDVTCGEHMEKIWGMCNVTCDMLGTYRKQ